MADEEIEILQSIYGTDLVVGRNTGQNWSDIVLSMKIVPILSKSKCVTSVRTVIELSEQYPKVPPKVYLREPRGFDENNLNILERKVEQHIEKNSEMHILYDIFQMVKDFLLDEQNVPCSFCPICLNKFKDGTTIICTPQCSHYIHSHCFARYVDHWRGQVAAELNQWPLDMRSKVDQVLKCPVCREPIDQNELSEIKKVPINLNNDDDDEFNFNWEEWKKKLKELQVLLDHQKAKGGLIDPEEERKRFLIGVESVSGGSSIGESSELEEMTELIQESPTQTSSRYFSHLSHKPVRKCSHAIFHCRNIGSRNMPRRGRYRKKTQSQKNSDYKQNVTRTELEERRENGQE